MIILIVGILLLIYGLITHKKFSVSTGILFVLIIMGLQEGVPGDYEEYQMTFNNGGSDGNSGGSIKITEFTYVWLSTTFSKFMSFHWFVLITSIIQCAIFASLISKYADKRYQYFGVFLIYFTVNIMLLQMKAMRQGYAVDAIILAYLLLDRRKYTLSILAMILAYGFHNSTLVAIPFYLILLVFYIFQRKLNIVPNKGNNNAVLVGIISVVALFVFLYFKNFVINDYINPYLLTLDFFEYANYLEDSSEAKDIRWWVLLYYAIVMFCTIIYFCKETNIFKRYLAVLSILAILFYLSFFGFGNLMRLAMFFVPFNAVVFPNVAAMIRESYGKKIALGYVIFNLIFAMKFSVEQMLSEDYLNGVGFYSYTFSFLK